MHVDATAYELYVRPQAGVMTPELIEVDARDGSDVSGVLVRVAPLTTLQVAPGQYVVTVGTPDWKPLPPQPVTVGAVGSTLDFTLNAFDVRIRGHVLDSDGLGVIGIVPTIVGVQPGDIPAVVPSGPDGSFAIGIKHGSYTLFLPGTGVYRSLNAVRVDAIGVDVVEDVELVVGRPLQARGVVHAGTLDGPPAIGAQIVFAIPVEGAEPPTSQVVALAETDQNGRFGQVLPAGEYLVRIGIQGQPMSDPFPVNVGDDGRVSDLVLR